MAKKNKSLKELKNIMKKYPQVTINVETTKQGKEKLNTNKNIQNKISELNQILNEDGRVLVRPSGTENLIRVMIEGKDKNQITQQCEELANYINQQLNN